MRMTFDCNIQELAKGLGLDVEDVVAKLALDALDELQITTPVDTGRARAGWNMNQVTPDHAQVVNNVEYIVRLNEGHSKKAPAMFVEAALDKVVRGL